MVKYDYKAQALDLASFQVFVDVVAIVVVGNIVVVVFDIISDFELVVVVVEIIVD